MNSFVATRILTILTLVLLACSLAAEQPEKPPQGQGKYLIVLWHPGTPVPSKEQERMRAVPEPNVASFGGRVLTSRSNRRVVFLPFDAANQLRQHEAVAYVQRIWTGEDFSDWKQTDTGAATSRPERIAANPDQFTWAKDYAYDADGNITDIGTSASGFDEFTYDDAGRLTSAVVDDITETYTYDAFGNLTAFGRPAGTQTLPVDPATNRLAGANYDAAGNITTRDEQGYYLYDPLNMMVEYKSQTSGDPRRILYDANDERIGMTDGTTLQRWTIRGLDGQILREFKGDQIYEGMTWWWTQDHIRGEDQLIAGDTQEWNYKKAFPSSPATQFTYGGKRHYHLDHLGSVRIVTNQAGKALAENDFFPFGAARSKQYQEQPNPDNHTDGMRFAGHWRDFMGLSNVEDDEYIDYMHARYYDPFLGRFLSVDPGRDWDPKDPQSWNLYAYVRNNPIGATDPDGRQVVAYQEAAAALKPVAEVLSAISPASGAAAFAEVAVRTLGIGTKTGTAIGSGASSSNVAIAAAKDFGTASEFALLAAGTAGPVATAARAASSAVGSSTVVNLGGEGEIAARSIVNVQPTLDAALHATTRTSQQIVVGAGNALPFQTGRVSQVVTNNVPIGSGHTWLGARYSPSEISRIQSPLGTWTGSSAPRPVLTRTGAWPW